VGDVASQALSITNTAVADGFSEKLNASFGATTDARILTNAGTISQLAAGQTNNTGMVISLNTAAAGVVSGSARVNLVSDGTGTSGLGLTNLPGQDVGVSGTITAVGNVYRLANPVIDTAQPVAFGNVRVGATASQLLSITNNVPSDGFSEKLNAQSGATTGGVTATGSFSLLSASATDNTNVRVGINTATAGLKNGTATINFQSDGTGTSGLGITNLASQNVTVTGAVYNMANGNATPNGTIALGNFRVGQPGGVAPQSQGIAITNTIAGPFTESLGVASASVNNAAFNLTNTIGGNLVVAGSTTNNALNIARTGGSAGVNTGTIAIQYTSDGAGTSGLAAINSNVQNITVNATGYNTAVGNASPNGTITLGNFRVGQPGGVAPQSQGIAITNTVAGPFTESLGVASASVNNAAFNLTNAIGSGLVAAGATTNNALNIARTGGSAGVNSGTIAIQYTSDGTGTSGLAAINSNAQNITVNATGYNTAVGSAAPNGTITLGSFRVGQPGGVAPQNQGIAITNTVAGPFTESLGVASASVNNAAFNLTNAIGSGLVAAGATTSNALNIARTGGSAGLNTGTIAIQYTSGLAAINSNAQNITVNATGYTTAVATVQSTPINFGIVHVGDVVATQGVSVANTAAVTAANDTLKATIGGATGPFTSSGGPVSGLTAGGTADNTTLRVGLNTGAAGVYSGTAAVGLTSQNADMADLGLGSQNINLNATVNKYANADFHKVSGAGAITRSGNIFTLDYGTVFQNSGALNTRIDVQNLVGGGPADLLSGILNVTDGNDFTSLLLGAFSGVGADAFSGDLLSLTLNSNALALGVHSDDIDLIWSGSNASGYLGPNSTYTLHVVGNIIARGANVPEPGTLLLMTIALAGFGATRRRKTV
jgi:PEP-CTERM motif